MKHLNSTKLIQEVLILLAAVTAALFAYQYFVQSSKEAGLELHEADGYNQVFWGSEQLTTSRKSHADPVKDGEFAAWVSESDYGWQIWLAHLPSNSQLELLRKGNNVNPSIRGNQVVWEGQVDDVWQILWFDGVQVRQISEGALPKQNPRFTGDSISYDELGVGKINSKEYKLSEQSATL